MKLYWNLCIVLVLFELGLCYITKEKRRSRLQQTNTPKELNINMIIHFDNDLPRKLPAALRKEPKRYLRMLARRITLDAENILRNLNLNQTFKLQLIDAIYLQNDVKGVVKSENVLKYLKSYCRWQSRDKKGLKRHFSVLFSGLDLVFLNSKGERNIKSTGRSFGGAICSQSHSCAVIEWHRMNSGYLLAHEIAHSLGVAHNGAPYNNCNPGGYVMSSSYNRRKPPLKWSSCSKNDIQTFLSSHKAWCLLRNQ